ncbi:MAG TPA: hypothetical protein VFX96_14260, partial [Pyrinomonadaceae bacterium]|nr:hypothetical protein [Pyrinomonadaceae bacterium]
VPARPFTVRCPKCQQIINAQPQASPSDNSALAAGGDLPASTRTQREARNMSGAQIQVETTAEVSGGDAAATSGNGSQDLARMLAALLRQSAGGGETAARGGVRARPVWDRRRALVCMSTSHGEEIARGLAASDYDVSVASDSQQAVGAMREGKVEVIVLDPEFDMGKQGAAQVTREVNTRRPSERRRLLLVEVSPTVRTGDAQAAFLANVNLVVNTRDVAELPHVLERTLHEFNDLYKDFNRALGVAEL